VVPRANITGPALVSHHVDGGSAGFVVGAAEVVSVTADVVSAGVTRVLRSHALTTARMTMQAITSRADMRSIFPGARHPSTWEVA